MDFCIHCSDFLFTSITIGGRQIPFRVTRLYKHMVRSAREGCKTCGILVEVCEELSSEGFDNEEARICVEARRGVRYIRLSAMGDHKPGVWIRLFAREGRY